MTSSPSTTSTAGGSTPSSPTWPPGSLPLSRSNTTTAAAAASPKTPSANSKKTSVSCHAPFSNFCANWLWWHACTLAHNVARWLRVLALPDEFHRCRAKRWRLAFFNVAARVVRHARHLWLRLPRNHAWADAFIEALTRIRRLPAYA